MPSGHKVQPPPRPAYPASQKLQANAPAVDESPVSHGSHGFKLNSFEKVPTAQLSQAPFSNPSPSAHAQSVLAELLAVEIAPGMHS